MNELLILFWWASSITFGFIGGYFYHELKTIGTMKKELKQAAIEYGGYGNEELEAAFIAGARWQEKHGTNLTK